MNFTLGWQYIQQNLHAGNILTSWSIQFNAPGRTVFEILCLNNNSIKVRSLNAINPQRITREDIETLYYSWGVFQARHITRASMRDYCRARTSTYVIGIIHWLEHANGGQLP